MLRSSFHRIIDFSYFHDHKKSTLDKFSFALLIGTISQVDRTFHDLTDLDAEILQYLSYFLLFTFKRGIIYLTGRKRVVILKNIIPLEERGVKCN